MMVNLLTVVRNGVLDHGFLQMYLMVLVNLSLKERIKLVILGGLPTLGEKVI